MKMSKLKIAIAQLPVTGCINDNFKAISEALAYASAEKADILLTPEGSLSGYNHTFDRTENAEALIEIENLARSLKVGMALGTCNEEEDGICYNELRFYTPQGEFLGYHTKTLRCGSMEEPSVGEINHYGVKPLKTFSFMGITIGGLICNDMWANPECTPMPDPHLTWQLTKMGARIIFHAVNGGGNGTEYMKTTIRDFHSSNLTMRAVASKVHIASVDACFGAHPVACPSGITGPDGKRIFTLPEVGMQLGAVEVEI